MSCCLHWLYINLDSNVFIGFRWKILLSLMDLLLRYALLTLCQQTSWASMITARRQVPAQRLTRVFIFFFLVKMKQKKTCYWYYGICWDNLNYNNQAITHALLRYIVFIVWSKICLSIIKSNTTPLPLIRHCNWDCVIGYNFKHKVIHVKISDYLR